MLNDRVLRLILSVLGLGFTGIGIAALYEWAHAADATGALAAVGVMATIAVAFAAVLTIEQNRALVKAATDEGKASSDTVEEMRRQREVARSSESRRRARLASLQLAYVG